MGQGKLWTEREWDRWDKGNGELNGSGTKEMVNWMGVGQRKWWTEREWYRWDKGIALEKLKINTKLQFEAVKGKGNLGVQGPDEMLETVWRTGPKELQFQLPSA